MLATEDAEDLAIGKIALITGLHTVAVRSHAVEEDRVKKSSSQCIRVVMVHHARIHVTELFRVTLIAAVSTARGLGIPGVRARDAACRDKPERCVLREIQAVEERYVRLFEAKRKTATLGCKLHISCLYGLFKQCTRSVIFFNFCFLCFSFYGPK